MLGEILNDEQLLYLALQLLIYEEEGTALDIVLEYTRRKLENEGKELTVELICEESNKLIVEHRLNDLVKQGMGESGWKDGETYYTLYPKGQFEANRLFKYREKRAGRRRKNNKGK